MNFWKYDIDILDLWIYLGIIVVVFLLSNTLRRKIKFIRNSLLPTAIIAGLIMLILKSLGLFNQIVNINQVDNLMESITYHALGLGVIAMTLKTDEKDEKRDKHAQRDIFNAGLITVNTYLIQAFIGISITIFLSVTFMKDLFPASGFLLPLGFGQGSGQAVSFGGIFEDEYGFTGGTSFGLMLATSGFLIACIIGVIHINIVRRKGGVNKKEEAYFESKEILASPNEVPATDAVDRLTIQVALILFIYFLTFLFMFGVTKLPLGDFGKDTLNPLIWGFNFLIGSIFALVLKNVFKRLRKSNIMTRDYPNNYLLNRISGFMFDIMIITGTAAIKLELLRKLLIPLIIIIVIGGIITYLYVKLTAYKLFPTYKEEAFVSMFGMLTGTTSTGMILLREVDSKFETPAANNLVYQSFYAIALGFPMFLLLGVAPKGLNHSIISLIIVTLIFIVFNIVLFRSKIFKKKLA